MDYNLTQRERQIVVRLLDLSDTQKIILKRGSSIPPQPVRRANWHDWISAARAGVVAIVTPWN